MTAVTTAAGLTEAGAAGGPPEGGPQSSQEVIVTVMCADCRQKQAQAILEKGLATVTESGATANILCQHKGEY